MCSFTGRIVRIVPSDTLRRGLINGQSLTRVLRAECRGFRLRCGRRPGRAGGTEYGGGPSGKAKCRYVVAGTRTLAAFAGSPTRRRGRSPLGVYVVRELESERTPASNAEPEHRDDTLDPVAGELLPDSDSDSDSNVPVSHTNDVA